MKIILTNDDGVDARGLRALAEAVRGLGDPVIFAPNRERSGCSHSTTTDRAFRVEEVSENCFAVEGTPADCVRVALVRYPGKIGWVISGINNGGNLGVDVYLSGTVAAVREAVLHGVPGIAVSHFRNRTLLERDWTRTIGYARSLLPELMARPWLPGTFWSVNFPCVDDDSTTPEIVYCDVDPAPLPLSFHQTDGSFLYNGRYSQRRRTPGRDVDVCFGGNISVSEISVLGSGRWNSEPALITAPEA